MSTEHVPVGSIVVGIDGSAPSEAALDWAASEAALSRRPLVIAHAAPFPAASGSAWLGTMGIDPALVHEQLRAESRALLDTATERVTAAHPDLVVHASMRLADPRQALLDHTAEAHLIVVGSRGLGPMRSFLLGSVSLALSKHSSCPVVVVRQREEAPAPGGVLVALEKGDAGVLELAFEVADARSLPLTVLHCFWDVVKVSQGAVDVPDDEPGVETERQLLAAAVAPLREKYPNVPVHLQLTRGFVDARLITASATADLIVVGHQAKPFLDEVIYGSVAPVIVEHAACSVAVVPQFDGTRTDVTAH
ncbi:universal stress protein [Nocardioides psychrotolerans]|uniref:Nucleotide-binding universal stress protein, UspA family n=1 Tax=Nocardioides psychrotolerans TaxID=1005945 RepID=A0A1I3JY63_9ACTN|nr:universal stress protein [Nocardioides psychrotolerans]GEP38357.1 universal stress protein [Nocardioides psychrotolerans]SFI65207.1 Nucleotide-binding universal stress protein, UspA family [Nocardioides psychrotolerans]